MSRQLLVAVFDREDNLLRATTTARQQGVGIVDAFVPYPVHGLDRALGLPPTRLPWVCFLMGLTGLTSILAFLNSGDRSTSKAERSSKSLSLSLFSISSLMWCRRRDSNSHECDLARF